ncbi:hypothetical protein HED60_14935 [Planctomycetales bacterium ZRK34]|nr:hypothetical protein HED60_14935 [Planctomycetales bacterium ZRK34]
MSKTWRQIADEVGISDRALRNLRQRDDFPEGRRDDAHVQAIVEWHRNALQENRAAVDLSQIGLQHKAEQMLLTRVKRELLEGKYISLILHEAAVLALTDTYVASLNELQQALPLALRGLDEGAKEKLLRERFDNARRLIIERGTIELNRSMADHAKQTPKSGRGRPPRGTAKKTSKKRTKKARAKK